RNDDADEALAHGCAHAARGEEELRIDGLDPGGGGEHGGEKAVDRGKGDLGFRADAEPNGEDGIENDQRDGIEDREHRHDPRARGRLRTMAPSRMPPPQAKAMEMPTS